MLIGMALRAGARRQPVIGCAAALVFGGLPALAFPAPSWWWLAWFGLVPLLLVVRAAPTSWEGALRAWTGMGGFVLATQYWLVTSAGPMLVLLAAGLGVLWLPAGWLAHRLLSVPVTTCRVGAALVVVPSAWVAAEAVRSWQSLGGPWALLGASQWSQPGGGVPYSEYPRFHKLMAEMSGMVFDAALIDVVLPLVDGLPDRLRSGADVADFGCGSGRAVKLMAQAFGASRFTGIDFSDEAVAAGTEEAARLGLANATFERHDLAELDKVGAYDVITVFDAIHDQAQPARVLQNIYRALRPGGVLLMVDIKASSQLEDNVGVPLSTYLYTTSLMHCMTVSLALDGAGLGTVWGRQLATSMLADAGFTDVTVAEIESDVLNNYYIARK